MRVGCIVLTVLVLSCWAGAARADEPCLDASERARVDLASKHLLDARADLRVCAASTCDETVRTICDERLAEVTARLPSIIFDVKDAEARDVPVVRLTIDGGPPSEGAPGAELTLDPGGHVFVFEAPGQPPVELRFVLVEREKARREHVVIGARPPTQAPPQAEPPEPPRATPWRTAGWVAIGTGAVGLGIGTAFGVLAIVKNNDANCDASNVCDDPRSRHDARVAANVSTVGFVAGGAIAAAGLGIVLFGGKPARSAAVVTPTPGGVSVAGRW